MSTDTTFQVKYSSFSRRRDRKNYCGKGGNLQELGQTEETNNCQHVYDDSSGNVDSQYTEVNGNDSNDLINSFKELFFNPHESDYNDGGLLFTSDEIEEDVDVEDNLEDNDEARDEFVDYVSDEDVVDKNKIMIIVNQEDNNFVKLLKENFNNFKQRVMPCDDCKPFNASNSDGPTRGDVARSLKDDFTMGNASESLINRVLSTLQKTDPSVNFFFTKDSKSNHLHRYLNRDQRDLQIDVCRNGCMVFEGQQKDSSGREINCAEALHCINPKCLAPRFSHCKYCKSNPYESCNPFRKVKDKGNKLQNQHPLRTRVAMDNAYYRSIMSKLIELYMAGRTDPELFCYDKSWNRVQKDGKLIDVVDGLEMKNQLNIMETTHIRRDSEYYFKGVKTKLWACSLLLSIFYDGKVNFKRDTDSMWPLLCTVLNCNPSLRNRLGVGMFLVLLHNLKGSTPAEHHLMKNMLVEELKALEEGIIFIIPQVDGDVHVLLQARCVYLHLDTRAVDAVANVKTTAKGPCPLCNCSNGFWVKCLSKCVYCYNRTLLDINHTIRYVGQRRFSSDAEQIDFYHHTTAYDDLIEQQVKSVTLDKTAKKAEQKYLIEIECPLPTYTHLKQTSLPMCAEYLHHGYAAENELKEHYRKYDERGQPPPKKYKWKNDHRNIKGIMPFVGNLDAFKYESFIFDFMHYIANVGKYTLEMFKGERGLQDASRKLCVALKGQLILQYKGIKAPWKVTDINQDRIDAIINSVLIPTAYKGDHSIKNVFKQTGYLKFKDHMTYMTTYASYCMSFSEIDEEYINYVARYAFDINSLLNPCVSVADLEDNIIKSVYETLNIKDGLFPISEAVFIFHEIIDICNNLIKYGHVRGLMCFAGERSLGVISKSVTKGGVHYLKSLYNRYIRKERILSDNLETPADFIDNSGTYSDFVLRLMEPYEEFSDLNENSLNEHYTALYDYIDSLQLNENVFALSPFYRLYKAYQGSTRKFSGGFYSWIVLLVSKIDNCQTMTKEHVVLTGLVGCSSVLKEFVDAALYSNITTFYIADFIKLHASIIGFQPVKCEIAIVKGIVIHSKGESAEYNDLQSTWCDKAEYMSWCRYEKVTIHTKTIKTTVETVVPVVKKIKKVVIGEVDVPAQPVINFPADPPAGVALSVQRAQRNLNVNQTNQSDDFIYDNSKKRKQSAASVSQGTNQKALKSASKSVGVSATKTLGEKIVTRATVVDEQPSVEDEEPKFTTKLITESKSIKVAKSKVLFGQAEYFYRVNMQNDAFVDGLAFACVTNRVTKLDKKRWHYKIDVSALGGAEAIEKSLFA